ncbi:MAG: UDP-4-amino-4,6-dideoxy-N-acetyl-beta-L-altrosamine transaminase [Erysipelotrichales bacterium]
MNIPYGKQNITQEDIDVVIETLKSDLITQGPKVEEFEKVVADYHNAKHAIAFSNGTTALNAAYAALDVREGDEIIAPAITFLASSNGAVYCGAKPVIADIDLSTNNIDIDNLERYITKNTKVICGVSLSGNPVNLVKIQEIAKKHDLHVIHDGAHAVGSRQNGTFGIELADFTMFSFHPVKHVTTGEGGMLLTNNDELAKKARLFRTHGITREKDAMDIYDGPWSYEMISLGSNFRLCDIQCALGVSQFNRIEDNLRRRNLIAKRYNEAFANNDKLIIPPHFDLSEFNEETDVRSQENLHSYHLYTLRLSKEIDRLDMFNTLREKNIFVQIHYIPCNWHKYYRENFGCTKEDNPKANEYYESEISIPMYHTLSEDEQEYVIKEILNYVNK